MVTNYKRFIMTIDNDLHEKLRTESFNRRIPISAIVRTAILRYYGQDFNSEVLLDKAK